MPSTNPRTILFVNYDDHYYEAAITRVTDIADEVAEVAVHVSENGRFGFGETASVYIPGDVSVDVYYLAGDQRPVVKFHQVGAEALQRYAGFNPDDDDGEEAA
jgi:hypothetical protein